MNIKSATVLESLSLTFRGEESGNDSFLTNDFLLCLVVLKQIITTTAGNTTTTTTITHSSQKIWVQNYVELQAGSMQYQPGTYVLPFQFVLPEGIPGSARFNPGNEGHAYISYIFNVEGAVPGIFTSNLRHSAEILVVEIFNRPINPTSIEEDAMITAMCCVDVGSMRFRACLDKNAYRPGDVANLQLFIDNSSSEAGYRYVSVKLRQNYSAVAGPSRYTAGTSKTLVKNRTASIPAGESVHATIPLALPANILPSAHGVTMNLYYQIQVVFSLKNSANITGEIPVEMFVLRTLMDEDTAVVQPMFSGSNPMFPAPQPMSSAPQQLFNSQVVPQNSEIIPPFKN